MRYQGKSVAPSVAVRAPLNGARLSNYHLTRETWGGINGRHHFKVSSLQQTGQANPSLKGNKKMINTEAHILLVMENFH